MFCISRTAAKLAKAPASLRMRNGARFSKALANAVRDRRRRSAMRSSLSANASSKTSLARSTAAVVARTDLGAGCRVDSSRYPVSRTVRCSAWRIEAVWRHEGSPFDHSSRRRFAAPLNSGLRPPWRALLARRTTPLPCFRRYIGFGCVVWCASHFIRAGSLSSENGIPCTGPRLHYCSRTRRGHRSANSCGYCATTSASSTNAGRGVLLVLVGCYASFRQDLGARRPDYLSLAGVAA